MSECKNKECTREAYVLDKPYCSSMCCISDLERQLKEARDQVKRLSKIAPVVKDKNKNYRSWFFAGRFMNGGELGNILLKSGWSDDDCRKFYYENYSDWDN